MGKVHTSQGHLNPASDELMSEPEIVGHIAHHTLNGRANINWLELGSNYELVREKISRVIKGFNQYNQRLTNGGFYLPNNAREGDFSKLPGGRAKFSVCPLPAHQLQPDEFMLMTMRSHDQFNTTIYGMHDRYRGVYNERRVIFMNPLDMKKYGLNKLDLIHLESHYDGKTRRAEKFYVIPYNIPEQNLAGYFPELNVLVPITEFADQSQTPVSKSIIVKIIT
jgi:anaerobic selenocysteine-containing dehydrogenase